MLIDTLNRVNKLRHKVLFDPDFLQSANEHKKAIEDIDIGMPVEKKRKSLSKIYSGSNLT